MRKSIWVALLLVLSVCILPVLTGAQAPVYKPFEPVPGFVGYVEDQLVVVLRPAALANLVIERGTAGALRVNVPELQRTIELAGADGLVPEFPTAKPQAAGSRYPDLTGYYLVHLGPGADLDKAVALFEADPNVEHVEKIGLHAVSETPNDTYYQNPPPSFPYDQWDYWGTHGIDADLAWDMETGSTGVVVGILDSGVRYFHIDIGGNSAPWGPSAPFSGGNAWINSAETPGNGIDDDGNGFIDDTVGWDFVASTSYCIDGDCGTADNDPDDYNGHGTHVAGTVAAITNNARLVAGIAGGFSNGTTGGTGNGVKVLPLRIGWHARYLGQVTAIVSMAYAAQAMNYVANLVDAGVDVAAVNCSWSSSNTGGLDAAVNALLARGVMVVHAAGNDNSSTADYLGNKAGVMNVAATDSLGAGASWTNYGSWVDVAAPGVDILSTYRNPDDSNPANNYIAVMSGTSMSTPHVCGIAALLESCNAALTGTDKFNLIVNNTTPYSDARNLGSGIANAHLALVAAGCGEVPCDIVADFSASPTSGEAPLDVQFTDQSTGAEAWAWDFGDGGTSTDQNPLHQYAAPDTYTVRLIATRSCGADTLVKTDYIKVTPCIITADFSASPTSGEAPLDVQFTDQSTGAEAWAWDFGDGGTSTAQNPLHQYAAPDTYTVRLIATRSCGADTLVKTDYIEVAVPPCIITADFSASPTSGEAPLDVQFTDQSTGAEAWAWDFGDGGTSTAQNPLHQYAAPDTYTVRLIATRSCGADTLVKTDYIAVTSSTAGIGGTPVLRTDTWAYPNPFNPGTSIFFALKSTGRVQIVVYDAVGRVVRTLVSGVYPAGTQRVEFDGRDDAGRQLASGVYFYRFEAPGASMTKKIVLLK
jgi:PKD repeat protein